jgi:hypothetical protein
MTMTVPAAVPTAMPHVLRDGGVVGGGAKARAMRQRSRGSELRRRECERGTGQSHQDELAHAILSPSLFPRAPAGSTVRSEPCVNAKVPVADATHFMFTIRSFLSRIG